MKFLKNITKIKKAWKRTVLIMLIFIIIPILLLTFICMNKTDWLNVIFVPLVIGGIASSGVSLFFTYLIDENKEIEDLRRELNDLNKILFENTGKALEQAYNAAFPDDIKRKIMYRLLGQQPTTYVIDKVYPELSKDYTIYRKYILSLVNNREVTDFNNYLQLRLLPQIISSNAIMFQIVILTKELYNMEYNAWEYKNRDGSLQTISDKKNELKKFSDLLSEETLGDGSSVSLN